jgi:hypothetical protein
MWHSRIGADGALASRASRDVALTDPPTHHSKNAHNSRDQAEFESHIGGPWLTMINAPPRRSSLRDCVKT